MKEKEVEHAFNPNCLPAHLMVWVPDQRVCWMSIHLNIHPSQPSPPLCPVPLSVNLF